jgi:hypothetical protein
MLLRNVKNHGKMLSGELEKKRGRELRTIEQLRI